MTVGRHECDELEMRRLQHTIEDPVQLKLLIDVCLLLGDIGWAVHTHGDVMLTANAINKRGIKCNIRVRCIFVKGVSEQRRHSAI